MKPTIPQPPSPPQGIIATAAPLAEPQPSCQ